MRANSAVASRFHASVCIETSTRDPSPLHLRSLDSATYMPAGTGSERARPVARSQITASTRSLRTTRAPTLLASGESAAERTVIFAGNTSRCDPSRVSITLSRAGLARRYVGSVSRR